MNKKNSLFGELRHDLPASIIVFLVAVPLCLGIAMASGAPLFSGIIAGIVGGIVVALLSGSPLGVSGPAAGLAVIVLNSIQDLGGFEIFLLAVVISGVIQIGLGVLKAGIIGYYFPNSVIKGMLSGIGIIIILKQIPHAFGYDRVPEGELAFIQPDGHNTLSEFYYMLESVSPGAILVAAVSMTILILWEQKFIKRIRAFQLVQGPLIVVIVGIVYSLLFMDDSVIGITGKQMVSLPVPDSFAGFLSQFSLPDFSHWNNPDVYVVAFTIAVVASMETLLCVEATDKLDPWKRVTPTNKELIAQGSGNIISGLIGGLPITQVIVRSSANIQSGGRTKASAFLHGVLILLSAMLIPNVLNLIPLASLAAILLMVGYKLAKPSLFKDMLRKGKSEFIPFIVTIAGILFTDLLMGITLGLIVGIFHILWNNYKIPYHIPEKTDENDHPLIHIQLAENVSFLNKAGLLHTFEVVPDGSIVKIDASKSTYIHPDVLEIIEDFKQGAVDREITVEIIELVKKKLPNPIQKFKSNLNQKR